MNKEFDCLKELINEQYSIYSNPQSLERQKNDARYKIITDFYNYLIHRYKKSPEIMEQAGIALMEACDKALSSYSAGNFSASGFFGYLYTIFKKDMNAYLIEESMNSKSGKHFTPHAIKIYRRIQKNYSEIIEKLRPGAPKAKVAGLIAMNLGMKEETVLRYLEYEDEHAVSIDTPIGEDEDESLEALIGDESRLTPDILISSDEEFYRLIKAFQEEWVNDKKINPDASADTKDHRAKLNAYYSKAFTYEILEDIDYISVELNWDEVPDFSEYPIIDKDILGQFKNTAVDFQIRDKKAVAAELGLKTVTNEYNRFKKKVLKSHPELKELLGSV